MAVTAVRDVAPPISVALTVSSSGPATGAAPTRPAAAGPAPVLVVGHDDERFRRTREALAAGGLANPVTACRDGVDAAAYLLGRPPFLDPAQRPAPAFVITDLDLPRGDGIELLRLVRSHVVLRETPVVVVGDGATDGQIADVHRLGASAFLSAAVADMVILDVIRGANLPWTIGAPARVPRPRSTP